VSALDPTGARTGDAAIWPADTSVPLSEEDIGTALAKQAARTPDRAAVVEWVPDDSADAHGGILRSTTYGELHEAASRVARWLLADAEPGERIGVWAANSTEWVVLEYATALSGLVLVPINPALTEREADDLLLRSGCVAVLAGAPFRGRDLLTSARTLAGRRPGLRRAVSLPDVLDGLDPDPRTPLPAPSPHAPFLIQYTSGTTGSPKGAVLTQHAALNVGTTTVPLMGLDDAAVWVSPLPLHHVGASVCGIFPALASAGTFVTVPSFDPAVVLHLVERCRAAVLGAVPTVLLAMLELPDLARTDVSSLRVVQIGGSTVAPSLIRRAETAFGARVVNAYGQSEAPSAAQTRLDDSADVKALTIGRPGLHREARIVRPGTGRTAAFDEPGELCLRSPLTTTGYFDDPARTAETVDRDGWLHTGDLCAMDAAGNLTIHGRLRDVVIRGGENIYPAEVEDVLLRHPAVADVAVVGAPDERWGEQVAAFVRFRPGAAADWAGLEAHARSALAGFKVPRIWRAVEEFPLTASGKVQKFRLRTAFD
jgi:fatty-acyl-CoA synthase